MNIRKIYETEEGDVTEIISIEEAIRQQCEIARLKNHEYTTNKEAMMDLLQCPCTEITDEPIGRTVIPRVLTLEEAMVKIDELHDYIEDLEDTKEDCLNIYLIRATSGGGWDTYDSAVVIARDERNARDIHPSGNGFVRNRGGYSNDSWCRYEDVKATYIGKASIEQEEGSVICSSFNAG